MACKQWQSLLIALLFSSVSFVAAYKVSSSPASFVAPRYVATDSPVRVTYTGFAFNNYTKFRLSDNISQCNVGQTFTPSQRPTSTIGPVLTWTRHDSSTIYVADFGYLGNSSYRSQVYVCYSRTEGRTWLAASNGRDRSHFRIFKKMPVAKAYPTTAIVFRPLYISVPGLDVGSRAALVTKPTGCDGNMPDYVIKTTDGNFTGYRADETFWFMPVKQASAVYLCVASSTNDWSLVPFDEAPVTVWKSDSRNPLTGTLLSDTAASIAVYAPTVYWRRAVLEWTPALAAGLTVTATISIKNKTQLALSAADFAVTFLSDGSGTPECPLPTVTAVTGSSTKVQFSFTPQRWGRLGALRMTWKKNPLFFEDNLWNKEVMKLPNITVVKQKQQYDSTYPTTITRFVVQPGFATLDDYSYTSLMRIGWFSPLTNWIVSKGVPLVNGSKAAEEQTATLKPSITTGTITQIAVIPSGSTKCRFRVEYYFNATSFDYTTTNYIGRVALVARTSSTDITTLKTFYLYAQGRVVVVTGGSRANGQDGDAFAWERLGMDFVTLPSYYSVRAELEVYHGVQRTLLFGNLHFTCSVHARTPPAEVAALQRVWTHVGQSSTELTRWRDAVTSGFNGDPCINLWRGVTCRNLRVVELDLNSMGLAGQFPPIPELKLLETLDLRNNSLAGTFPKAIVNNTRLKRVYVSRNRVATIPSAAFSASGNACLLELDASRNQLQSFPTQVIGHPTLQKLDIAFNNIRGTIPNFGATSPLVDLDLSGNQFSDRLPTLPESFLVSADLSNNRLQGSLPKQWGNLRNIKFLDVSKNRLNGTIPMTMSKITSGAQLTFRAFENFFVGLLPNLPFSRVDLRYNSFLCPLPWEFPFVRLRNVLGMDEMMCDYGS